MVPLIILFYMQIGIFFIQIVSGVRDPFEEEIGVAVFGLGAEKSPGPDGFPIIFFQKIWDLVKEDILLLFSQFFYGVIDLWCLNYALIALILKKKVLLWSMNFSLLISSTLSSRSSPKFLPIDFSLTVTFLSIKPKWPSQKIDTFLIVWLVRMRFLQLHAT